IENIADDSEGDICFLEELLIDDSILSHESSDSNFEDNPSIPRPPPEPPDAETDAGKEIPVVMNDKDDNDDYSYFIFVIFDNVNDHVAKIMGYGDSKIRNVTISRVYFVEGLGHNLFSVGQFCDSDLEVAFCQHTCFIRNVDGVDLLTRS
nr:integrase, catalytic region, zinc finger, CCHC-type, peptidase aspartic, catalytic [Tanacetum cinerariifolium]